MVAARGNRVIRIVARRFPTGAPAALVFAHDARATMATQADCVCPSFQTHFRAGCDPSTVKRGGIDGESSHWKIPLRFCEPADAASTVSYGKNQSTWREPTSAFFQRFHWILGRIRSEYSAAGGNSPRLRVLTVGAESQRKGTVRLYRIAWHPLVVAAIIASLTPVAQPSRVGVVLALQSE
jgi:hypothetical protein